MAAFRIPLNLPHAGTIATRIEYHIRQAIEMMTEEHRALLRKADALIELLAPYRGSGENPPQPEAQQVIHNAAQLGREIVAGIEALGLGHDQLGQAVRNLFECLTLGEEGAQISLRAGENPDPALRPR